MMSNVQKVFMEWANKKYPEYAGKFDKVEIESAVFDLGYCETCSYEVAGVTVTLYKDSRWIKSFDEHYDLATILNEILEDKL